MAIYPRRAHIGTKRIQSLGLSRVCDFFKALLAKLPIVRVIYFESEECGKLGEKFIYEAGLHMAASWHAVYTRFGFRLIGFLRNASKVGSEWFPGRAHWAGRMLR
jgi:hypothetical protein